MKAILTKLVRDPRTGRVHGPGECLPDVKPWRDLGTHREWIRAHWADGGSILLNPDECKLEE